nr:alcohol dehydrogenase catalytic domain-containing protein [uncultured Schaedlerella sp.]
MKTEESKISKTMKALVAYGIGNYKLVEDFETPVCGDDDIIIKTEGCGICAGDLKCWQGAQRFWGNGTEKAFVEPPFIPGHEFTGRIVEIGNNVKEYQLGERLTADQIVPCGKCRFCKNGRYSLCSPHDVFGFKGRLNGGMAEYVRFPKTAVLHRIPESMELEKALLIEPYSCSKHAVDRAKVTNEDVVVLSGAGTLGLGMLTYMRMKNPRKLIVLDLLESRLEKARQFGADITINPAKENAVEKVMGITQGYGCDVYIEATGNPLSVGQGLKMLIKQGRFVEFSVFSGTSSIDWSIIGDEKELDILGSHLSPWCYDFVIEKIMSGEFRTDGVITKMFPIEKWKEAFECADGKYGDLKVAFVF